MDLTEAVGVLLARQAWLDREIEAKGPRAFWTREAAAIDTLLDALDDFGVNTDVPPARSVRHDGRAR